ncbi:ankyrin repeat domain-containing protein [Wolbachia endosymbiont of Folsomia candida]|uniref:ankyrin repeat domain-containing protein n=1 Tax=Wolbachia endosymbiont of Folsomia candida TaxID=169402 RepID=UPI000B26CC6A|nr:ankyrin repeat domain-containing protein [Wolbachia endosymbiont of Folsomia candida]APR97735.1 hypothetical protein ASM33_00020 [Wolbachia endosymbiont of Folsomia candida]
MPRDLIKLVASIICNPELAESEKVTQLESILERDSNIVHAKISKAIWNSVITPEYQYYDNSTLLHFATRWNYTEIIRLLIKKGADVDTIDKHGNTPLHNAALNDKKEVAELLVIHGASILKKNLYGHTPLRKAALYSHEAMVKLLLEKAYGIDALAIYEFVTIMHHPKLTEDKKIKQLRLILDKNPNIIDARVSCDISESVTSDHGKYEDHTTLLHIAAICGYTKVAELLIDQGADVNDIDKKGNTPLHNATLNGKTEVAELLLERGANIESGTICGYTPLHIAASHNSSSAMVKLLLDKGADVNACTDKGKTVLELARSSIIRIYCPHNTDYQAMVNILEKAAQPRSNVNETVIKRLQQLSLQPRSHISKTVIERLQEILRR